MKVFVDMMGLFPVGTLVRLATGELGIVYEQNEADLASPKVKVIRDPDGGDRTQNNRSPAFKRQNKRDRIGGS